jgi:hypothetical protein
MRRRINADKILYGQLAVAAAACIAGQSEEARQAVENIERRFPGYGRQFSADAESRNLHPALAKIWARLCTSWPARHHGSQGSASRGDNDTGLTARARIPPSGHRPVNSDLHTANGRSRSNSGILEVSHAFETKVRR